MQKIIAANWKMYKTRQEARETAAAVAAALNEQPTPHEVVVFAPFTAIADVADAFAASQAQVGAQDVWPAVEGAFTGEISPRMLQDAGAVWVLTGHSERRHVLGESDELVGRKTAFALEQGLKVMLCIGEKLEERESGQLEDVLRRQLDSGLPAGETRWKAALPWLMSPCGPSVPARWPVPTKCWPPMPWCAACCASAWARPATGSRSCMVGASNRPMPVTLSDLTMWMVF